MHPLVVGEIACGILADRALTLDLLLNLPAALVAESDEALIYLDQHRLHGKGIGYVDVHLLASAAISGAKLWTRDKRLRLVACELRCSFTDVSDG